MSQRLSGAPEDRLADRIEELAKLEMRRTEAFEAFPMLADGVTIEAAHVLNEAVWKLEQAVRPGQTPAEEDWLASADEWITALNSFHAAARDCLSVVGTYSRRDVAALAVDRPERRRTLIAGVGDQQAAG